MRNITVLNFRELSEEAKKVAVESVMYEDVYSEEIIRDLGEEFRSILTGLGMDNLDVEFSLSCSQGDGVAFYGYIDNDYLWNWVDDAKLSDDEVKLVNMCVLGQANLDINIERNYLSNMYSHWNTMEVNISFYDGDDLPFNDDRMEELMRGLEYKIKDAIQEKSKDLERLGYKRIEQFYSVENMTEILEESSFEFYEDGTLYA